MSRERPGQEEEESAALAPWPLLCLQHSASQGLSSASEPKGSNVVETVCQGECCTASRKSCRDAMEDMGFGLQEDPGQLPGCFGTLRNTPSSASPCLPATVRTEQAHGRRPMLHGPRPPSLSVRGGHGRWSLVSLAPLTTLGTFPTSR